MLGRCCIGCGGRRNCERYPGIPAGWPIGRIKFAVGVDVQISLHVAYGKDVAPLGTHPDNPRSEAAEKGTATGVIGDLLIGVSNKSDEGLLRKKLGGAPVEMESIPLCTCVSRFLKL